MSSTNLPIAKAINRPHANVYQALNALEVASELTDPESTISVESARAALHDYLHGRLAPSRRHRVELHLDGCAGCTRAFIDVREVSWTLRGLRRRLVADGHLGRKTGRGFYEWSDQ